MLEVAAELEVAKRAGARCAATVLDALHTATLRFGRIVVSDIEAPNLLMNLV
jgi:hypothetical protein